MTKGKEKSPGSPLLEVLWPLFQAHLLDRASTDRLFNPYALAPDPLARPDAGQIRRDNLAGYLGAFPALPRIFVMAEAPGSWGARFSGVPLTSEAQLVSSDFWLSGTPTSPGDPHTEYSGRIYHRVLAGHHRRVFTWNAVPLHPHRAGAPLTIRTPTRSEVKAFVPLVAAMVQAMEPDRCVAIGRVAEAAFRAAGVEAVYVRHPSQGGAKLFEAGMQTVLNEKPSEAMQATEG